MLEMVPVFLLQIVLLGLLIRQAIKSDFKDKIVLALLAVLSIVGSVYAYRELSLL